MLRAIAIAMSLALAGCGLLMPATPPPQGGSANVAIDAADAFLSALVNQRVEEVWSHLTPETREAIYGNERAVFARDVTTADWSNVDWEFDTVTDLDTSWGVHVRLDEATLPPFLVERGIAAGWEGFGIVLHVQTPEGRPYLVAGQGLDIER